MSLRKRILIGTLALSIAFCGTAEMCTAEMCTEEVTVLEEPEETTESEALTEVEETTESEELTEPAEEADPETDSEIAGGSCGENLTWTLDQDGLLYIAGSGEMYDYTRDDHVPWHEYASEIRRVFIDSGVLSIGDNAFRGCSKAAEIRISETVTSIGWEALYFCYKLESISVDERSETYCSVDGVLFNRDQTELIQYPLGKQEESYVIPKGVKTIARSAFEHSRLQFIEIPKGVTLIGQWAFASCRGITSIEIPASVKLIDSGAFSNCEMLKKIVFYGSNPIPNDESVLEAFLRVEADVYYSEELWGEKMNEHLQCAMFTWHDCIPSRSEITNVQSWGYNALKITWKPVRNAEGYRLYYQENPGEPWKYLKQINDGDTTSFVHLKLVTGKNYTYYVRAFHQEDGERFYGAYSSGKTGRSVPRTVQITGVAGKTKSAAITWNRINGASGYRLYYKTSPTGKWSYVTQIGNGAVTSYTHKNLPSGQTVYYMMRAYRTVDGEKIFGRYSEVKSAKVK